MNRQLRIGTRDSALALWQANEVKRLLALHGYEAQLVPVKTEGDINLTTPLYEMGVQGVFTRSLDAALLNDAIDLAVHSMKDVPTALPAGIVQAAVLPRASHLDLFVPKPGTIYTDDPTLTATIATSSIRRKAQWLHRYPQHRVENLRGNVNTRLRKVAEQDWQGAIFAAAGLDRIGLRPDNAVELHWMLPAPAQGAIMVVCRASDELAAEACALFNDADTALCTQAERDFLRTLMGGCSMPISALAQVQGEQLLFEGNILDPQGREKISVTKALPLTAAADAGKLAGAEILGLGAAALLAKMKTDAR